MSTQQLTATLTLTDGSTDTVTADATRASSAPTAASVNTTGLVTAVGPGE